MAKGLRSKIKRHFRGLRRDIVDGAEWKQEAEAKRQTVLDAALAAPTTTEQKIATGELDAPMEKEDAGSDVEMDGASKSVRSNANPDKILNRIKKSRAAKNPKRNRKDLGKRRRR